MASLPKHLLMSPDSVPDWGSMGQSMGKGIRVWAKSPCIGPVVISFSFWKRLVTQARWWGWTALDPAFHKHRSPTFTLFLSPFEETVVF